jgi:hypothetical protein
MSQISGRRLSTEELVQGLDFILDSPSDKGTLELIVRRPDVDERESLAHGRLDTEQGLVGDNWIARDHDDTEMQLNIMNSRVVALVADDPDRRELAGDQLYLDMDLSYDNLPPGTRLSIGDAVIEVTEPPHTGCKKFAARFGVDAMVFVNSGMGRKRNFRGICARVIKSGDVKVGDIATKLAEG